MIIGAVGTSFLFLSVFFSLSLIWHPQKHEFFGEVEIIEKET